MRQHLQGRDNGKPEGSPPPASHHHIPGQDEQEDTESYLDVRPQLAVIGDQPRVGRHKERRHQTDDRSTHAPAEHIGERHRDHAQRGQPPHCGLDVFSQQRQWQRQQIHIERTALDPQRGAAAQDRQRATTHQPQRLTSYVYLIVLELHQARLRPAERSRKQEHSQHGSPRPEFAPPPELGEGGQIAQESTVLRYAQDSHSNRLI